MLARFWFNVVFFGLLFGVTWGAFMALFLVLIMGMPLWLFSSVLPLAAGAAGVLFGLSMAGFAHVKTSHHALPSWQSLVDAERSAP